MPQHHRTAPLPSGFGAGRARRLASVLGMLLAVALLGFGQAAARPSLMDLDSAVGSLEGRVLVSARRFRELGATTAGEIEPLAGLDRTARSLQAPELNLLTDPLQ